MSRLSSVDRNAFTAEELKVYEQVAAVRQNPHGPTAIWSRSPLLAQAALPLGNFLRFHSSVPGPLRELAILVSARHFNSQNEWNSHRPLAEKEGVDPALLDLIAKRQRPVFSDPAQEVVFDVATALAQTHDIDDATYERAQRVLGERVLIELITTVGFYGMLSLLLRSTRAPLPEGVAPPLPA